MAPPNDSRVIANITAETYLLLLLLPTVCSSPKIKTMHVIWYTSEVWSLLSKRSLSICFPGRHAVLGPGDVGLGHVVWFGQWSVPGCDISWGLRCVCLVELGFLCSYQSGSCWFKEVGRHIKGIGIQLKLRAKPGWIQLAPADFANEWTRKNAYCCLSAICSCLLCSKSWLIQQAKCKKPKYFLCQPQKCISFYTSVHPNIYCAASMYQALIIIVCINFYCCCNKLLQI